MSAVRAVTPSDATTDTATGTGRTTESPTGSAAGDLSRLAKILGNVVAPTTALTALLFYFGWSHAYWFFHYIGVNSTLLGLSTSDYLMRSMDGLFVPLTVLAVLVLGALWARELVMHRLRPDVRARLDGFEAVVVPVAGAVLVVNGLSWLLWENPLNRALAVAPLSLATGVLLVVWAVHRRRVQAAVAGGPRAGRARISLAEWTAVFLLVGLSAFWLVNDYSAAVGNSRAREFVARMSADQPGVVLFSERSLSLDAPGVREVRCTDPQAAFGYRYDGLTLVLQSGDQYVLLPTAWNPDDGAAILVPRANSLRLEFSWGTGPDPTC